jgi:hypothetical protein
MGRSGYLPAALYRRTRCPGALLYWKPILSSDNRKSSLTRQVVWPQNNYSTTGQVYTPHTQESDLWYCQTDRSFLICVCVCLFMSTYFYISCKYMCPYFPLLVWYHHIQTIYIDGTHYKWLIDFSQHASIPCHQQLYTMSPSNRSYVYVFNRLSVVNTMSLWVACHEILVV